MKVPLWLVPLRYEHGNEGHEKWSNCANIGNGCINWFMSLITSFTWESNPAGSLQVKVGTHVRTKFHEKRGAFNGSRHGPWISRKRAKISMFPHKKGCEIRENLHWKGRVLNISVRACVPTFTWSDPAGRPLNPLKEILVPVHKAKNLSLKKPLWAATVKDLIFWNTKFLRKIARGWGQPFELWMAIASLTMVQFWTF